MQTMEPTELGNALQGMWEPNRESLRRLLISLTRDIDLADDLLQETYLRARSGLPSYRGGDARAWLAAIAKNVFYAHARRTSTRMETALLPDEGVGAEPSTGSPTYLNAFLLRQAVSDLSPTLRTALIMKHYGGFTYSEIAERLGCPVGTAKWRVSEAIGKLRYALGAEEEAGMKCTELAGTGVLDYLYGIPKDVERERIRQHIEGCAACREIVAHSERVVNGLDAVQGDYKMMHIVEFDEHGPSALYSMSSFVCPDDEPTGIYEFCTSKGPPPDYISIWGEEVPFKTVPFEDGGRYDVGWKDIIIYNAAMPRPALRGERVDELTVFYRPKDRLTGFAGGVERLEDGTLRYRHGQTCSANLEIMFVLAIRLPVGAEYSRSTPAPDEQRTNGTTTLTWRQVLAPNEQFECELFYTLPQ